jgi:diguanylate cyclase (GGDEF)-like protein
MFRLSRYYSIASLIGMLVIVVGLSLFLRQLAVQVLLAQQTRSNVDLTRSYANAMGDKIERLVAASEGLSAEALRRRPELATVQQATQAQMKGMNVVKVKVYNLAGMTVFSTEAKQIGEDKGTNVGFQSARAGEARSEIVFRDQFYAIEEVIVDRNLITTYIPIRDSDDGPVKAVFEVYTDVTPLVVKMQKVQTWIVVGVSVALLLLYLFLFLIVRRADRILAAQESERKINEDLIRHQAFHDSLTGLPNRNGFSERITEAINRARRHGKSGALLFLDLDRFKLINDSLGHDAGDHLLRVTASRIQKSLRETDLAFRLSGDEFMVIVEDIDRIECAALAARRILEAMASPVPLSDCEVIVNMSIGITMFSGKESDVEALVKEADSAMYRAKEIGHNQFVFYTQEMNTLAFERLSMETDLQRALQHSEYLLHYQPKVDTATKALVSVEALLRWNHPKKGIVLPNTFIPLLEDTGLINEVGEWVLMEATRQAQAWIDAGLQATRMSVNISGKQFRHPGLIDTVRRALEVSGLDPRYLELELTESMFIENTQRSIETMQALKALGISLSIDDFGTGYSSLAYLKMFPVDYLKIDRSFIRDLTTNSKDAAITAAISALAHSLNLRLVAEGVENQAQVEFLESQGCHELQGFLFSRPVPAHELEASLRGAASIQAAPAFAP